MKFRREMAAQMEALNMDPSYADRYLNVGFSGGEKKKAEILQLLMLKPALALLDETDSGLDVDAVKTVASGIKAYHNADNALIIITHNAKITEGLQVDYVHVLDDARIVRTGDGSLVNEIIEGRLHRAEGGRSQMRAFETEKTEVAEIDRSVYDIKDKVNAAFEVNSGLTAEIVEQISKEKHDPDWMREFRLKALDIYNKASIPNWGPSLEGLDMPISSHTCAPTPRCEASGAKCPMTSRTRLSVWAFRRPSARAWRASAHSTTPRSFTTTSGGGRSAGRRLHRYGERPDRPLRRHGEGALHEVRAPHGPQVCGAARRCVGAAVPSSTSRRACMWTFPCSPTSA